MRDKKDNLESKAKDAVFEKVNETMEDANKRRTGRVAGSSSDVLSSIRPEPTNVFTKKVRGDELGELESFDDADFSFVPKKTSSESDASVKGEMPFGEARASAKAMAVGSSVIPRIPKVQPVRLEASKVYPATAKKSQVEVPFGEAVSGKKKGDKAKKDSAKTAPIQPVLESQKSDEKTEKKSQEKGESKAEEMEVVSPDEEKSTELSHSSESTKAVSKWAFWKRPSRRDEQLARISDGYVEMVDLVRAISSQLESQNENNVILRDSLSHLPEVMTGLDRFSKSQHTVGEALQEIHGQIQRSGDRDDKLVDSMQGFNSTLQGMDITNQATMKTFDRVQERMNESDTRMEGLFEDVQETEVKVSDTMVRLQRNMAIMQGIFLFCLLAVIGVLVFFVLKSEKQSRGPVPSEVSESVEAKKAPVKVVPRRARDIVVPLTTD